jgi:hypothetical protein
VGNAGAAAEYPDCQGLPYLGAGPDDPSIDAEAVMLARAVADLDDELAGLR